MPEQYDAPESSFAGSPDPASALNANAAGFAQSFRILMATLIAAPVVIGIALFFVHSSFGLPPLPGQEQTSVLDAPNPFAVLALVALCVASHFAAQVFGHQAAPLDPTKSPEQQQYDARLRHQSAGILRLVITETPIIIAIAISFVITTGGFLTFALPALIGVGLLYFHCWPAPHNLVPVVEKLEANGGRSGLLEDFGFEAGRL